MNLRAALHSDAPAKLNLTLEILGRRADGYHDLVSLAQTVDLVDTLTIAPAERRRVLLCDDRRGRPTVSFSDELVGRAWDLLVRRCGVDERAAVTVVKRIPVAAGLGGGSSDAAAFLRLARVWWDLELSDDELGRLGAELGSDVPLFLAGGTVLLEGRGERIAPLDAAQQAAADWAALVYTPVEPAPDGKTRMMYAALRRGNLSSGRRSRRLAERLGRGGRLGVDDLHNAFDAIADHALPGAESARARLQLATGLPATLVGAGPSLFVIGAVEVLARAVRSLNRDGAGRARLVRPLPRAAAGRVGTPTAAETAET